MNHLVNILSNITGRKVIFPFYHAVADTIPIHLKHLYSVRNTALFERDIQLFLKNYEAISIAKASEYYAKNNKHAFCLTFDDGLREFKELAWPILKKYYVPVTLFVNTAFVDNKDLFYRFKASLIMDKLLSESAIDFKKTNEILGTNLQNKNSLIQFIMQINYANRGKLDALAILFKVDFTQYLKDNKPYLTTAELLELQSEGVTIGAHSHDHPLFNELSLSEQLLQISKSMNWVIENFKQDIKAFSFPFTDFGLKAKLFENIFDKENPILNISMGTAGIKKEVFANHLQRIPLENSLKTAKQILIKEYLYYIIKFLLNKNTIRR